MSTRGNAAHVRGCDELLKIITLMAIYSLRWLKCHLFIHNI